MPLVLLLARLLLAAVFAVAGFGKLTDRSGSRQSLTDFGTPNFLIPILAFLLPLGELLCALALLAGRSAWYGAAGVLALLLLFIAAIAFNMALGRRPDCHCFGQLHSEPVGWKTLARNVVLSAVAALILWQGPGASLVGWWRTWNSLELLVLALGLALVGLGAFTFWLFFHLLGRYGRLLLRLETIEAKMGIDPDSVQPAGLPIDSPAPAFSLPGLDGRVVTLDALQERGLPVLLLFTEPDCNACQPLLPDIRLWQMEQAERLVTVVISRGSVDANREKAARYSLENLLLQDDREVALAYKAEVTPSAALVSNGRIASPLSLGADAIRGLVARTVLPRINRGQSVPSLPLPDLGGRPVDLGALRERRSLLLFWSPTCGYCQQMLPELKRWEKMPLGGGPRLFVISSGSAEENRRMGFRSTVLLDQASAAMNVFGATGTPSAIMLDESGRVASGVEVGADAVLALAGVVRVAAG